MMGFSFLFRFDSGKEDVLDCYGCLGGFIKRLVMTILVMAAFL